MLAWLIISVCLVVGFLVLLCFGVHNESDDMEIVGGVLGGFSLMSLIVCCVCYPIYKQEYTKHVADIMSISREGLVEGHFTLGCGTIKETQYYFYYYETGMGVKLDKVRTDKTYVIETDKYVPSIYKIKEINTMDSYYNLYVPYDTIVTTYVLN